MHGKLAVFAAATFIIGAVFAQALNQITLTYGNSTYTATYNPGPRSLTCASNNTNAVWNATVDSGIPTAGDIAGVATGGGPIFVYTKANYVRFCMLYWKSGAKQVPMSGEALTGTIGRGRLQKANFYNVGSYGAEVTVVTIDGNTEYTYKWQINSHGNNKELASPISRLAPQNLAENTRTLSYKNSQYTASYNEVSRVLSCSSNNVNAVWQAEVDRSIPADNQWLAAATGGGPVFIYSKRGDIYYALLYFNNGYKTVPNSGESLTGRIGPGELLHCHFDAGSYGAQVTILARDGDKEIIYEWDITCHGNSHQLAAPVATIVDPDSTIVNLKYQNSEYQGIYNSRTGGLKASSHNPGCVWLGKPVANSIPSLLDIAAEATPGGPIFIYTQNQGGTNYIHYTMLHFRTGNAFTGPIGRGRLQSANFAVGQYGAVVTIVATEGNTRHTYNWDINYHGNCRQIADPVSQPLTPAGGGVAPPGGGRAASGVQLSILFLVDCSGSMGGNNIRNAKQAVRDSVAASNDGRTEWALLGFGDLGGNDCTCWQVVPFTTDANQLNAGVDQLVADGGTPLQFAVNKAITYLATNGQAPIGRLVVLCDGENNCSADGRTVAREEANRNLQAIFRQQRLGP